MTQRAMRRALARDPLQLSSMANTLWKLVAWATAAASLKGIFERIT